MSRSPTSVPLCGTLIKFILDPEFHIERTVLANGTWESHISQLIDHLVKPGDNCLNVGANFGFHTLSLAHKTGPTGKVIAFEPNTRIKERLERNCQLNPTLKDRITIHSQALGEKAGHFKLFEVEGNSNAYVAEDFCEKLGGDKDHFSIVEVVRLDDYLEFDHLDLILVDIEGMEPSFFAGAKNIISKHRPIIIYETLIEHFCDSVKESEKFFTEQNYILLAFHPSLGKLIPVKYPTYLYDTIAVPKEKAVQILSILNHVKIFELFIEQNRQVDLILGFVPPSLVAANLVIENQLIPMIGQSEGERINIKSKVEGLNIELNLRCHGSPIHSFNGQLINLDANTSIQVRGCLKTTPLTQEPLPLEIPSSPLVARRLLV